MTALQYGKMCIRDSSIPYSTFPGYAEVQDIMGEAYNSMLTGTSLDDAMATVDSRITDLLAEYNK